MTTEVLSPIRTKRRLRWRWLCGAALVMLAIAGARLLLIEGWWTLIRIVGPSMAPTLHGEHGIIDCQRCTFAFAFDTQLDATPGILICPNCGHVHSQSALIDPRGGDRVWIDKWPIVSRGVRRMDVVAFTVPRDESLAVKRVIGLPGETLEIRQGEIYLDGQLWQKSLDECRMLSALVHDASFGPPKWASEFEQRWEHVAQAKTFSLDHHAPGDRYWWLQFRDVGGIEDVDHYNPSTWRPTYHVFDVRVAADVLADGQGKLACRLRDGWSQWLIEYDMPSGRLSLSQNGSLVAKAMHRRQFAEQWRFEAAVVDQQVFVAIGDRVVLQHAFAPSTQARTQVEMPVQIGARGAVVELTNLRVYRDVYWLEPAGGSTSWSPAKALGEDEYFLLGDNVPVSTDSRHFGAVKRDQIRGIVKKWPSDEG